MTEHLSKGPWIREEEWRQIRGYEGVYEVSSQGRVRRIAMGGGAVPFHVLRPAESRFGYQGLALCHGGRIEKKTIHQLVAEAFHGPRPNGYDVNHIDGVKVNNHYKNLQWVTRGDNHRHAYAMGLKKPPIGEDSVRSALTMKQAKSLRLLAKRKTRTELAYSFCVSVYVVDLILKGRTLSKGAGYGFATRVKAQKKQRTTLTPTKRDQIKKLVKSGSSMVEVAILSGVSCNTVFQVIKPPRRSA